MTNRPERISLEKCVWASIREIEIDDVNDPQTHQFTRQLKQQRIARFARQMNVQSGNSSGATNAISIWNHKTTQFPMGTKTKTLKERCESMSVSNASK